MAIHCTVNFSDLKIIEPNELGDSLAGFFAPLAFLWLFFGYYQQGQELKQNTEALRLQSEELSNLVREQEKKNKIYESEMNDKRAASKPIFSFKNARYVYSIYDTDDSDFEGTIFHFTLTNHGSLAKDIKVIGYGIARAYYKLEPDADIGITFSLPEEREKELFEFQRKTLSIDLGVWYCDNSGYQYHKKVELFTDDFVHGAVGVEFGMKIRECN